MQKELTQDDVWLFELCKWIPAQEWTRCLNQGNNIAYNSLTGDIGNIYAVDTKANDMIDLVFADGVHGNLIRLFRTYYRVSNGEVIPIIE